MTLDATLVPPPPRHVAVAIFGGLGYVLLASPVIHAIKARWPEAHLTLITEKRSQSAANLLPVDDSLPLANRKRLGLFLDLTRALRRAKPDIALASGRSPFVALAMLLAGVPVRVGYQTSLLHRWTLTHPARLNPALYASEMHWALAQAILGQDTPSPVFPLRPLINAGTLDLPVAHFDSLWPSTSSARVLIHPGASRLSVETGGVKQWPPAFWAEYIQNLLSQNHPEISVGLCGGPDDADILAEIQTYLPPEGHPRLISFVGQTTSVLDLAALIQSASVLACIDSAPMHLGVALNKPVVAMFGPTNPDLLLPAQNARFKPVFQADLACRPCLWATRSRVCDNPVCLTVSPQAMIDTTLALLITHAQILV